MKTKNKYRRTTKEGLLSGGVEDGSRSEMKGGIILYYILNVELE